MARDLALRNFWNMPAFRWFDWDDEEMAVSTMPSGLSISEDEKNVYVEAAVPGINPEDVEITFDKGMLWIKGEKKETEEDKKKKYYRSATTTFQYKTMLPIEVDPTKEPEATSKNGIMKITFAKHPQTQPKKIKVKAS
ncbi:Hsp20/alpha crystallin family protein [Candidatus Beckwithbacteria bacterium]|nr:Hsp20/alpha crystallin family protein [Candidatus Beckwithbacteria bacterium]